MISCPRQWPLFPERVNCVVLVGSGCVIGAFWWQVKEYPIYALTLHSYWPNCKMLDLYLHLDGPDSELNFFYLHSDDIYLKLCDLRAFSISGKRMVIFLDHWFLQQKKTIQYKIWRGEPWTSKFKRNHKRSGPKGTRNIFTSSQSQY